MPIQLDVVPAVRGGALAVLCALALTAAGAEPAAAGVVFDRAFGWGTSDVCARVCFAATNGNAAGQLQYPWGVAVSGGEVFVASETNGRVDVFTTGGTFARAFGKGVDAGPADDDVCTTACGYGLAGGGAGRIAEPRGVAVSGGEVYVADDAAHRISVFTTAGRFVRAFARGVDASTANADVCTTACEAGTAGGAAGQLSHPWSVAVSGDEVYVTELGNQRISVFTPGGTFVRAFGKGVDAGPADGDVCTSTCEAGAAGAGAGQLNGPYSAAVDGGEVFVADGGNHRIGVYTTAGAFLRAFGKGVDASAANADVCTTACEAGAQGGAGGRLAFPKGVAVGGGEVYVADTGHRISVFTPAGLFVRAFAKGVDAGTANGDVCTTACDAGTPGGAAGQLSFPSGLAIGGGEVYVSDPGNRRMSVFTTAGGFARAFVRNVGIAPFVCTSASGCARGEAGGAGGQLNGPFAVAVDAGEVYVADRYNHRISVFTTAGAFLRAFGRGVDPGPANGDVCTTACEAAAAGAAAGQLSYPFGIAVSDGEVYVADQVNHRVSVFTTAGAFVRAFGTAGAGSGQLNFPSGLAVGDGVLYVADSSNHRISVFTTAGTFLRAFARGVDASAANADVCASSCEAGVAGGAAAQLSSPGGVTLAGGELLVGDRDNDRVSVFTTAGTFVRAFGKGVDASSANADVCASSCEAGAPGAAAGQLRHPSGVAVRAGDVYVADEDNSRIAMYTRAGGFVRAFGRGVDATAAGGDVCTTACRAGVTGGAAGQLFNPLGIAIGGDELYVGDQYNQRISVFDVPRTELSRTADALDFGTREIHDGPTEVRQSTVTNSGTEPVTLTGVSLGGGAASDFDRLTGDPRDCAGSMTLAPGDTCTLRVRFDPASEGAKAATLTVSSNAADVVVALAGAAPPPGPSTTIQVLAVRGSSITVRLSFATAPGVPAAGYRWRLTAFGPWTQASLPSGATSATSTFTVPAGGATVYAQALDGSGHLGAVATRWVPGPGGLPGVPGASG